MRGALLLLVFLTACTISPPPAGEGSESGPDPEMGSAFAEARASLDEFVQRLDDPNPTRTFAALKVRFTLPDGSTLDIWCDDVAYEDGQFTGNLGDDLPSLKLSFGDRLAISPDDIVDWMIVEDGKLIGGFTIRLAYSRMTPEEKQFFLNDAGYSIDE